jgi:hypothetical protein
MTCRAFVKKYGNLAVVDDVGRLVPLFWPSEVPGPFAQATAKISTLFTDPKATKEFRIKKTDAGKATAGGYKHLHFAFPRNRLAQSGFFAGSELSTSEAIAMLHRVLTDYSTETIKEGLDILESHRLQRASNHVASANWLWTVAKKKNLAESEGTCRHNLEARYAVTAFLGCLSQLRTGPLSILLKELDAGTSFGSIRAKRNALTAPEHYMRPSVAPQQGNAESAGRLFAQLGLTADDMRQRFMCMDEVPSHVFIWRRKDNKPKLKIFGSITTSRKPCIKVSSDLKAKNISFTKLSTKSFQAPHESGSKSQPAKPLASCSRATKTPSRFSNGIATPIERAPTLTSSHSMSRNMV